jgi:hypothetical protein
MESTSSVDATALETSHWSIITESRTQKDCDFSHPWRSSRDLIVTRSGDRRHRVAQTITRSLSRVNEQRMSSTHPLDGISFTRKREDGAGHEMARRTRVRSPCDQIRNSITVDVSNRESHTESNSPVVIARNPLAGQVGAGDRKCRLRLNRVTACSTAADEFGPFEDEDALLFGIGTHPNREIGRAVIIEIAQRERRPKARRPLDARSSRHVKFECHIDFDRGHDHAIAL